MEVNCDKCNKNLNIDLKVKKYPGGIEEINNARQDLRIMMDELKEIMIKK